MGFAIFETPSSSKNAVLIQVFPTAGPKPTSAGKKASAAAKATLKGVSATHTHHHTHT